MPHQNCNICVFRSVYIIAYQSDAAVLNFISQLPAGDPDIRLFARQPNLCQWAEWFKGWKYLKTIAFICEDTWWRRSSGVSPAQASEAAQSIIRQWLVDCSSSLQRFEMWSGADSIKLSPDHKIQTIRFHAFDTFEAVRHQYAFGPDETTGLWTILAPTEPMRSAVSPLWEEICNEEPCWIGLAVGDGEALVDLECMILCWDDVKDEDWEDRITALRPWSWLDIDRTYMLSV